jgi:hypothetical protein
MSITIDQAFVKQFESEVHVAYQRKGSLLRGMVRTKTGIVGNEARFQKYSTGTAATKSRHGLIQTSDVAHTYVDVTLADYYFGEWVDKLDELKTNIDERMLAAEAGAMALGRKTDALIVVALDSASTNTVTLGTASKAAFKNKILEALEALNAGDVPDDGQRYGLVSARAWSWLMLVDEFVNSRYIGEGDMPFTNGQEVRQWLGVRWMVHTGLTKATNDRTCHLFHKNAVGHAIGADVSADITWHGDRAAHFIANSISQGAVLIDGLGTCEMVLDESAALATS